MLRFGWLFVVLMLQVQMGYAAPGPAAPSTPRTGGNHAAEKSYKDGLRHRDAAWVYEEKMAGTKEEKDREPYAQFIRRTYLLAVEKFQAAVDHDPKFFQAYSNLGYVLRKTGDLEGALKAYDRALFLNPTYAEAIEYRAEAYFELGRVADAQKEYVTLAGLHKPYAARLLVFAEKWASLQADVPTRKAVLAWVVEKRAALGEVKDWVEKW